MSILGKVLAILNVLAVIGAVALLGMDYAKRRSWAYAVFRQQLVSDGLPVDDREVDGEGHKLVDDLTQATLQDIFKGSSPVKTQLEEVKRVQSDLSSKIQGAGDKKKQLYLLARILTPLALTGEQRTGYLAYQVYLRDDASFGRLQALLTAADQAASQPPQPGKRAKPYEEGFNDYLAGQFVEPPGPLAEAFLAVKKTARQTPAPQALDQALDTQLAQLQGQFDQAFKEALEQRPPAEGGVKSDAPSQQKRIIAHLLFCLTDVLPDETAGGAPKLDLMENPQYRRFITVVGVGEAVRAVNDEAALLKDMAVEVNQLAKRDRLVFAAQHHKVVEMIQEKATLVERHGLTLARKQKELATHEEDLKKRRLDVAYYQEQLTEARKETAAHLKELRAMSDALFQERVKLRDATERNQQLEKDIRKMEDVR
jgi:hypothetical protein